tara:strand:+ start:82 stop:306 length:225 start_codon:yes stop_codon:yes gene_type:complete
MKYTKFEKARIIGSRALQISMGAPMLIKLTPKQLEEVGFNPIRIATLEFEEGVIPITVRRPFPSGKVEHRTSKE